MGTLSKNPPPMLVINESSIEARIIIQAAGFDHHIHFEMGRPCCSDLLKDSIKDAFPETHQTCVHQPGGRSELLYNSNSTDTGICMPGMAQHADEEAVVHDRIAADTCDAYHIR